MTAPQTGVYRRTGVGWLGSQPTPTDLPCAACLTVATATAVLQRSGARRALNVIVRAAA